MTYWIAVCEADTDPGVRMGGSGVGSIACNTNQTTGEVIGGTLRSMEVSLMVVPPAGSSYAGFWDIGTISTADALIVSSAIAGLWAIAWGFRQLRNAAGVGDSDIDS